ncbi:hypothetical protein Btru_076112 [Bulinus truncatus]|nr:hypothetical protein Btru_076112 [Bulinus truncatus]
MDKSSYMKFLELIFLLGSALVDCDFDNETTCNWQEANFTGHHWFSTSCHLLCADPYFVHQNTTVELVSPSLPPTPDLVCFSFWYILYKPGLSDLSVSVVKPSKTLNIWQVNNQVTNAWRRASINIASDGPFQLSFHFTTGTMEEGSIAIDDIKLNTGPCTRKDVFDFEGDNDDFTRMYDNVFDWELRYSWETSAKSDHTYMSPYGKLLYADMRNRSSGDMSSVISASFPPAHEECLFFWYIKRGSNTSTFQAFVNLEIPGAGLEIQNVWAVNEPANEWTKAFVDITAPNPYRIGFQVMVGNDHTHDEVFVDDVRFSTMACPRVADCDFENSFVCGYQTSKSGDVQWRIVMADDPSSVIPIDHTTQSRLGSYMQVDFPTTSTNVMFIDLVSQPIPAVVNRCLTFWYSSAGTKVVFHRAYSKSSSQQNLIKSPTGCRSSFTGQNYSHFTGRIYVTSQGIFSKSPFHCGITKVTHIVTTGHNLHCGSTTVISSQGINLSLHSVL